MMTATDKDTCTLCWGRGVIFYGDGEDFDSETCDCQYPKTKP